MNMKYSGYFSIYKLSKSKGIVLIRLPVAAKMAFAKAGAKGGIPGDWKIQLCEPNQSNLFYF